MKDRLILLYLLFCAALAGVAIMSVMGGNAWIILLLIAATSVFAFVIFNSWMLYISQLVKQSNQTLNQETGKIFWFSFSNIEQLEKNQKQIALKFEVSAELISNLAHPERVGKRADLIANDPIGKALQSARTEMLKLRDDDEKQAWISNGLTHMGKVMRNRAEKKEYCFQIVSSLVKYLGANQGGLYIEYEDGDGRYLELSGCYAYEKRKHLEGKIIEGQGLLGQCMLEKEFVFMTDVPQDYVKITSGLGYATPRNLVVAPLIFNRGFYGVIELAFFQVMPPHHVEFLKRVCENIASEIASLNQITNTQQLLEESHTLTQELQSHEEEMRQNMEELAATQEEMARKQAELNSYLAGINNTIASAEFDLTGRFKNANDIFLKVMGYAEKDLLGKCFDHFMGDDSHVVMMWENLKLGKFFSGEFKMKDKAGKDLRLTGTFNPISVGGSRPEKIMMFAQFTTQEKEKVNELNGMVMALKSTLPVIEFNDQFVCKTANEKALKIFGMSRVELRFKTILDFIPHFYHTAWKEKQFQILEEGFLNTELPFVTATEALNMEVSFSVTKNLEGKVSKVIVIFVREVPEMVPLFATM